LPAFDLSLPTPYFPESEYEATQWRNHFLESYKQNDGSLGLDSETSGLVKHKDIVILWSLSDGVNRICLPSKFIPLYKDAILENPEIAFDLTNAKYDAHMFANTGADISKAGPWHDTVVQSFLWNENNQGRHGLKDCVRDWFGLDRPGFTDIFGKIPIAKKGQHKKTTGELIHEAMADPTKKFQAIDYASMDAFDSTRLRARFDMELDQINMYDGMSLKRFFHEVEAPFTKVLWKLERRGFQIDAGYLAALKGPMESRMAEIEKEFCKAVGQLINLNSTNHVRSFFFDFLKKTPVKYTDGGTTGNVQPSVDADVLDEWAGQGCEWSKLLLEHRGIRKIYGTYVVSIMDLLDHNLRVHTSLNQTGAQSGRLSSSDPNLQNIPAAREDKFKIREAFVASAGKKLIVADYAQLEMRLMAHFSNDHKMIKAILDGIDLHCFTVSEMYGIPYEEVIGAVKHEKANGKAKDKGLPYEPLTQREEDLLLMRQAAKATGFGIIYGIGGPRLAAQLTQMGAKVYSPEEGYKLIDKWFGVFPGVRDFIEMSKKQIQHVGFVQTLTGRFRRAGDVANMTKRDRGQIERTLVNAIIQGSAADIAKASMLRAEADELLKSCGARMLLQVHDELIFEVDDEPTKVDTAKKRLQEIMEDPFGAPLRVPLPAEVGSAYSWAAAK
jgi:DNA polymerase I